MTIAIDYDGTYAADPTMFDAMITLMQFRGHSVILVTGRSEEYGHDVKRALGGRIPIVFAGLKWKKKAAEEAGYNVQVWVDDNPEYIGVQSLEISQHKHS